MGSTQPKPYDQRSDLEKIQSQWTKLSGLLQRHDWSAAVVRAATATEIAVNLAIRREFAGRGNFSAAFVDGLLKWANGVAGKLDRLLLPLLAGDEKHGTVSGLSGLARTINDKRNDIAHRGEFCSEQTAIELIDQCQTFVLGVVRLYKQGFTLQERSPEGP
jgi:hypothetical protein